MLTAAVEYPAAIAASAWRTSAAVRSRSLRAPMTLRMGSRTFWHVLLAEPVRLVMTSGSGAAPSLRVGMLSTWRSPGRGGFSLVCGRG